MGNFRIALGRASCKTYNGSDSDIGKVCKIVFDKLSYLKTLQYSQLSNWKESESDISNVGGKNVSLTSYVEKNKQSDLLIVVQAFYPTLIFPNYLSFTFIGKVFAEGFIISSSGDIKDAKDKDLWSFK